MKKLLFIFKHNRSFILRDLKMLSKHFYVIPFWFSFKNIFKLPLLIYKSDVIFIWFASYHAFITTLLTRLIRRKTIVVTGGYDVAGEQEIKYGLMIHPMLKHMVRYVLKRADSILAVSEFNKKEIEKHLGLNNAQVIYNSVDSERFYPYDKKANTVITVGFISWENIRRKGMVTFVKSATYLPNISFVVIGEATDDSIVYLKSIAPSNVKFPGFVSDKQLLSYYQTAKVYCQLSYYESYGMTPAEAMLCECIPVVCNRGALPEVIGETGFFAPYGDIAKTAGAIEKALKSKNGKKARERIIRMFSDDVRERELKKVIDNV